MKQTRDSWKLGQITAPATHGGKRQHPGFTLPFPKRHVHPCFFSLVLIHFKMFPNAWLLRMASIPPESNQSSYSDVPLAQRVFREVPST